MGTVLAVVALILALGTFFYAWLLRRDLALATRRLDRYNRALFDASDQIRQMREETAQEIAELKGQVLRSGGHPTFSSAMTIREVYALHPQAQEILAAHHLGGCSSCAVAPDDQLGNLLRANGLPTEQVLHDLNLLFGTPNGSGSGKTSQPQPIRLPNLQLE